MDEIAVVILLVISSLFLVILSKFAAKKRNALKSPLHPPGPKPLPIVGNLYDLPKDPVWRGYNSLASQFGTTFI